MIRTNITSPHSASCNFLATLVSFASNETSLYDDSCTLGVFHFYSWVQGWKAVQSGTKLIASFH